MWPVDGEESASGCRRSEARGESWWEAGKAGGGTSGELEKERGRRLGSGSGSEEGKAGGRAAWWSLLPSIRSRGLCRGGHGSRRLR
jgi:hypothetical protein